MNLKWNLLFDIYDHISKEKLHFIILNYTLDYTLHPKLFKCPKLFECTVCTLNYDTCYTLHLDISFTIILDGTLMHMTRTYILFKWNKVKRQKNPSSKKTPLTRTSTTISPNQNPLTLNPQIRNIFFQMSDT